ncbi:MAG: hypothetical protein ACI9K1_001396, partial [Arcticibacterium sp.]
TLEEIFEAIKAITPTQLRELAVETLPTDNWSYLTFNPVSVD